jgi:hypothetical protein
MSLKGSAILFMGRLDSEASPLKVAVMAREAIMPLISRMVVPLFPQSKVVVGECHF